MSGLVCPHCGGRVDVFGRDGAKGMAERMHVELLASLPLEGEFAAWADRGGAKKGCYSDLKGVAGALDEMVDKVVTLTSSDEKAGSVGIRPVTDGEADTRTEVDTKGKEEGMEIFAIPTENGLLCSHFGHCEQFTLVEAGDGGEPAVREVCEAPPHEPGLLPRWLAEKGVNTVIAGGMGARAQQIFAESGVKVLCGAPQAEPLRLVRDHLAGTLELGDNACDH